MIQILLWLIDSAGRTQRPVGGIEGAFKVRLVDGMNFREGLALEKYLCEQWFITLVGIIQNLKIKKGTPWIA
ncbi:MAG: hypothetical protein A3E00_04550 [Curvibacter sp. RIFCSPHIGHO2_12_FULL_63_18]|nr:MAG: hypothetical protein A2037_12905 [Curvibacter sp. GWA2_63_95]OGP06650.1 MAG: hypothetical protein A3E00_04550 [Curvibacter sp. RIFCSPHIGHO2_12_FULL_63_18]